MRTEQQKIARAAYERQRRARLKEWEAAARIERLRQVAIAMGRDPDKPPPSGFLRYIGFERVVLDETSEALQKREMPITRFAYLQGKR